MEVLERKTRGYNVCRESYNLCDAYSNQRGIPVGVLLLYILVKDSDFKPTELIAKSNDRYTMSFEEDEIIFSDLNELNDMFTRKNLSMWDLRGVLDGVEMVIYGRLNSSSLSVSTPLNSDINVLPLIEFVELSTYNYHSYDTGIVNEVMSYFNLSLKDTVLVLSYLESDEGIYNEFISSVTGKIMGSAKELFNNFPIVTISDSDGTELSVEPIEVEGFTANDLYSRYPFSQLGSYLYLVYLKISPKDALSKLGTINLVFNRG